MTAFYHLVRVFSKGFFFFSLPPIVPSLSFFVVLKYACLSGMLVTGPNFASNLPHEMIPLKGGSICLNLHFSSLKAFGYRGQTPEKHKLKEVTEERLYQHVMAKSGLSDSKILKYCADVLQKSKKICFHFVPLKRACLLVRAPGCARPWKSVRARALW